MDFFHVEWLLVSDGNVMLLPSLWSCGQNLRQKKPEHLPDRCKQRTLSTCLLKNSAVVKRGHRCERQPFEKLVRPRSTAFVVHVCRCVPHLCGGAWHIFCFRTHRNYVSCMCDLFGHRKSMNEHRKAGRTKSWMPLKISAFLF